MTEKEQLNEDGKKYFIEEISFTDEQLDRMWDFFRENLDMTDPDSFGSRVFTVTYCLSGIGTSKNMLVSGKKFWIDEDESDT